MREVSLKVYSFEELSEKAKERVISDFINDPGINQDTVGMLEEDFEIELKDFGFKAGVEICFSLNYCQGDGVAFYGGIDMSTWIQNNQNKFTPAELQTICWLILNHKIEVNVTRNSYGYHYSHAYTMDVEIEEDDIDYSMNMVTGVLVKLKVLIQASIRDMSKKLESEGYETFNYYNSKEHIVDLIECNGYEFFEDGSMY